MTENDWQRLKAWQKTGMSFDYAKFKVACNFDGCEPQSAMEFSQKAGMISCALAMYPSLDVRDAYLKFIQENQLIITVGDPTPHEIPIQSRGIGDTIAKITHATGLDKLSDIYTRVTGKPCGCSGRQEALNKLLPYGIKEEN